MGKGRFPTWEIQQEIKNKANEIGSNLANHMAAWTAARAVKLDKLDNIENQATAANGKIQATLNTPNGDNLGNWLNAIKGSADNAANQAAAAYSKAVEANNNAWNANNNIVAIKNVTMGHYIASGNIRKTLIGSEQNFNLNGVSYRAFCLGSFFPEKDGSIRIETCMKTNDTRYASGIYYYFNQQAGYYHQLNEGSVTRYSPERRNLPLGTIVENLSTTYALGVASTVSNNYAYSYADIQVRKGVPVVFYATSVWHYSIISISALNIMYDEI